MVSNVKITVLRRMSNPDLIEEYAPENESDWRVCEHFLEGQEFVVDVKARQEFMVDMDTVPKGFCVWAWAAIEKDVSVLALGGNAPWLRKEGTMISCCTDGLRPVVFKLERI
jgi:uncharacterized repeat protein (TIGR04076 family)